MILAPTRDLIRQHVTYFTERLEGTGIGVGQIHGGAAPGERRAVEAGIENGTIHVVVGSAMMLTIDRHWEIIDKSDLLFVDDVNAFDEREHLRLLEDLDCPMLFATATPDELRRFLDRIGAMKNVVSMKKMPFDVLPTKIHKVEGVWGEPPAEQLSRADALIKEHLARGSRIFVIGRTRGDVPRLARAARADLRHRRRAAARRHGRHQRTEQTLPAQGREGQRGRHAHRDDERASAASRRPCWPRPT